MTNIDQVHDNISIIRKSNSASTPATKPQLFESSSGEAKRVRFFARLTALVTIAATLRNAGTDWLTGVIWGALVVEINLSLLIRVLSHSATWLGHSLWPTIFRFYLIFGFTLAICALVIINKWGHPLAFLLGLLSFFIGLVLAIFSFIFVKPTHFEDVSGNV
ncbi:MAG: hypothetical protein AMR96_05150 [Candidatus Adiutrix intracellularis]|nr:MAG: hypothetical protein AMR96_05150 [Candidatus Adiutrix intracellularis]